VLLAALAIVVAVAALSSEARRMLENWYVGAPFALTVNAMRVRLNPRNDDGCLERLAASGQPFRKIPDTDFPPDCPVVHAVALEWPVRSLRFMTCGLATAVHAYWTDGLQRLASDILGEPIVRIGDLGVRNCRPMTGHRFLRSEHAFANAIDFAEFELASGDIVRVKDAWYGDDRRAWFVHEAARRACDFFSMVVTPDHDPDHRDHIHVDVGIFSGCELDQERLAELRALGGR
jgi:hypothetical protein